MSDDANKVPQEPQVDESLQKDVQDFNAELIPLLGKYSVGLGAATFITPDGRIGARPTLFRAPAAPSIPGDDGDKSAPSDQAPQSSPSGDAEKPPQDGAIKSPIQARALESAEA